MFALFEELADLLLHASGDGDTARAGVLEYTAEGVEGSEEGDDVLGDAVLHHDGIGGVHLNNLGIETADGAVEAWTDVAVMPERMGWWLTATVGAVCLRYCLGTMHRVWLWMKPLSEDYYSNPDDLPLEYARQVLPIPVVHGVAAWTAFLIGNATVTAVVMVLLSVFNVWFLILVLPAHRHREDPMAEVPKSAQKPLPSETVSRIRQQLQQYVETEEHFLDPHLTLSDVLAGGCTYNRSYVSRVLNEEMGCTFSAYVNRLRLQRADDLRRQEPQAPIGDIIDRSGFDSPSNYYKAKRKYGEE